MERGKARYALISAGSNTTVKSEPGTLYAVLVRPANGATVRIEDSANLGTAPNLNDVTANTIVAHGTYGAATPDRIDFGPGVEFDALTVAATSNSRVTVIYE